MFLWLSILVMVVSVMIRLEIFGDGVRVLGGCGRPSGGVLPARLLASPEHVIAQIDVPRQLQRFVFLSLVVLLLLIPHQLALVDGIAVREYLGWVDFIADDSIITTWHLIARLSVLIPRR